MPDDTTMFQKGAAFAKTPKGKGIGIGGLSATTLVALYAIFVPQKEYEAYKMEVLEYRQATKQGASEAWQMIQDLDIKLDSSRLDVEKLKAQVEFLRLRP